MRVSVEWSWEGLVQCCSLKLLLIPGELISVPNMVNIVILIYYLHTISQGHTFKMFYLTYTWDWDVSHIKHFKVTGSKWMLQTHTLVGKLPKNGQKDKIFKGTVMRVSSKSKSTWLTTSLNQQNVFFLCTEVGWRFLIDEDVRELPRYSLWFLSQWIDFLINCARKCDLSTMGIYLKPSSEASYCHGLVMSEIQKHGWLW